MDEKKIKREYKNNKKIIKDDYKRRRNALKKEHYDRLSGTLVNRKNKQIINPPLRHGLEEIGNSITHLLGAVFSIVAFLLMIVSADDGYEIMGAVIYFVGLFLMFTASCLYHAFPYGSTVKRLFRRFDYSSIYLLIGATFAPILLSYVGGTLGFSFFIVQWLVIAAGISLVGVFGPTRLRFIHIPLYVILGWCGIIFLPQMIRNGDISFLLFILGGGVIYSVGIIPFVLKKRAAHFIWHLFVLAGATVQWIGVWLEIYS